MSNRRKDRPKDWMSLPKSSQELYKLFQNGKRHPAMKMASTALNMKRSPNQVFLLLVGLSGAGKSSTINYLFEKEIAPTSETESKTRSTDEFVVTMISEEWKIPDLKLSVIDTPGFSDTQGLEQDAKNVLSIKKFLNTHPSLIGCFPNIVFVVLSILDNRIVGTDSQFAKMLKGLSNIEAVDHNNPNVVVVLTHAAGLARNPAKWMERAERKKLEVKAIVELNLGVTPEVVFQENLPDDFELDQIDDWHILPNGEKQPKTLYKACEQIFLTSDDLIGHEAMAVCFRPGSVKPTENGRSISSFGIDKESVKQMYSILIQSVVMVSESEVGNMLEEYKKNHESTTFQNDILLLQVKLRDINLKSARDIQSMTMNSLVSKMYPVRINGRMEKILEDLFGIKYQQLSGLDYHIGSGYNLFRDTKTAMTPLQLSGSGGKFGLPDNVLLRECSSYEIKCQAIKTNDEYVGERLNNINVNVEGSVNYGLFNMKMQYGYNMQKSDSSATAQTTNRSSFLVEQKMYKVEIQRPFKLNSELERNINDLPNNYNLEDNRNLNRWKAFFEKWGYYVIIGAYIGGSLSGQVLTSETNTQEKACEEAQMALAVRLSYFQNKGEVNINIDERQQSSTSSSIEIQSTSIQWNGGDKALHKNSLENITFEDWARWIESLEYSPASLWTSLDVYPMYQLVAEVSQEKSAAMQKALNLALTGKFVYSPPKPDNRENTGKSNSSGGGCFHAMSTLSLSNGEKKMMKDLEIGDQILVSDSGKRIVEDVVIAWIHKNTEGSYKFLKISHTNGIICLTPEHILFVGDKQSAQLASTIEPGNKLVYHQSETTSKTLSTVVTVLSVEKIDGSGVYAPLTKSGRLLVDGIPASCYCSISPVRVLGKEVMSSHSLAHFGFLPIRISQYMGTTTIIEKMDKESGINMYAKWLKDLFLDLLQSDT